MDQDFFFYALPHWVLFVLIITCWVLSFECGD